MHFRFKPRRNPGSQSQHRSVNRTAAIEYNNPKLVVGAVCVWQDRVLLCRRAIEPRSGFWTIPAGYLELGETAAEGARREVEEESGAEIEIGDLFGIYEIPRISQVYLIYRAVLRRPELSPGAESLDAVLFEWSAIPWHALAFPSGKWALEQYPMAVNIVHHAADPTDRIPEAPA